MTKTSAFILVGALALSACTDAGRFGSGAPEPAQPPLSAVQPSPASDPRSPLYFQNVVGDRVLFVVDSSALTDQGRATLDGQAQWLLTNTDYMAVIEGHADEQGTREYNLALGARRANAVREYLASKGIATSRMRTVSYGKERPIEVCSDEACYAKNRRAVTIISAGGVS